MTITLYGIPNCDTVKKARSWLDARGIAHEFHDYKKHGADPALVAEWMAEMGVDTVLNRRGTTWKKLSPEEQAKAASPEGAVTLLTQHPSMVKRPVVVHPGGLLVGFDEKQWESALL
ncbi:arsenate reductase [Alteraurantiacibacter palmitatis]|uniref:Arsenate reductase n=1 Tax=Alteraurantiacibacter palmitatis TaxID=2054628 RepID=A0ABV7E379_9SPHN